MDLASQAAEMIARDYPQVWQLCYPRRILPPNGFPNPKAWSTAMWGHTQLWATYASATGTHATLVLSTMLLMAAKVPTYFVEPEFARAVARTRLPGGLKLQELRWPLPSMLLTLHPSFSTEYFGFHVPFIGLNRAHAGHYPVPFPGVRRGQLICENDRLMTVAHVFSSDTETPTEYTGVYPLSSDISVIKDIPFNNVIPYEQQNWGLPEHETTTEAQDKVLAEKLFLFVVKLLLVLAVAPKTVRNGDLARPARIKHGRTVEALWIPSMIGQGYRITRSSAPDHGTHSSPRSHLRWGHMTHQVIGTRSDDFVSTDSLPRLADGTIDWSTVNEDVRLRFWKNHSLRWIEPVWVDPK